MNDRNVRFLCVRWMTEKPRQAKRMHGEWLECFSLVENKMHSLVSPFWSRNGSLIDVWRGPPLLKWPEGVCFVKKCGSLRQGLLQLEKTAAVYNSRSDWWCTLIRSHLKLWNNYQCLLSQILSPLFSFSPPPLEVGVINDALTEKWEEVQTQRKNDFDINLEITVLDESSHYF